MNPKKSESLGVWTKQNLLIIRNNHYFPKEEELFRAFGRQKLSNITDFPRKFRVLPPWAPPLNYILGEIKEDFLKKGRWLHD